jgi:hypothetical protein
MKSLNITEFLDSTDMLVRGVEARRALKHDDPRIQSFTYPSCAFPRVKDFFGRSEKPVHLSFVIRNRNTSFSIGGAFGFVCYRLPCFDREFKIFWCYCTPFPNRFPSWQGIERFLDFNELEIFEIPFHSCGKPATTCFYQLDAPLIESVT